MMAFQLFADSKRQAKVDAAYAAGFDPDAEVTSTIEEEAAVIDMIRDIETDGDPEMDAITRKSRGLWKASW